MSKSREKYWGNAEQFSFIEGINGDLSLNTAHRPVGHSIVSTKMTQHSTARFQPLPSGTPNWCHVAFMFERQRLRSERTDWSFMAPVWIAIGLFCTIVQVFAFKSLWSLFA